MLNTVVYNVIKEHLQSVLLCEFTGSCITENMLNTWVVHVEHQIIYDLETIPQNFLFILPVNMCDDIHAGEQTINFALNYKFICIIVMVFGCLYFLQHFFFYY
jgi:hypothetical protein